MNHLRNIQILIETMTRCGGNCSGCALSSVERMSNVFDFENFFKKTALIKEQLGQMQAQEVESVTIFLGQGDHFLMEENEIEPFVKACSEMIPVDLKSKTVVFITASAIGKAEVIKKKMDLFYQYSVDHDLPFFIQVVFDPKKMKLTKKFKHIYIENILYFKEKCGMTEVTLNMGEDLLNHMTPQEFHDWIKEYGFKHIEMNWVTNQFTYPMWKDIYNEMQTWLKDWLSIYLKEPVYEINFLPFMSRHFLKKNIPISKMYNEIEQEFKDNLYIDDQGNFFPSQMGIISNLTPFGQRQHAQEYKTPEQMSRKVMSSLMRSPKCMGCEYKSVCAISGSVALFDYEENHADDNECPWNIKSLLQFMESEVINGNKNCTINNGRNITKTIFDKNPVQSAQLMKQNNETHNYFEKAIEIRESK